MSSLDRILPFLRPIEDLLCDATVTEVMVNDGGRHVFVERDGTIEAVADRTLETRNLSVAIKNIARACGDEISEAQPLLDARLEDGSRVAAMFPPCAVAGPVLTIRKFSRRYSLDDLVAAGSLTASIARELTHAIATEQNILISGGTGTGKTTLLNALAAHIPDRDRIVLIEETSEIHLNKPNVLRLEARRAQAALGQEAPLPPVTIADLLRAALRHRPDRILVGEVRGAEAFDLLQALNTGHLGSLTTIHANSAEQAFTRSGALRAHGERGLAAPQRPRSHRPGHPSRRPYRANRGTSARHRDRSGTWIRRATRSISARIAGAGSLGAGGGLLMSRDTLRQLSALTLLLPLAACSDGGSPPTAPSGPQSFLAGTWRGTMTIQPDPTGPQPGSAVSGAVTWTFEVVPQTNLQTFRTTIRSENGWLPITLTLVDIHDSGKQSAGADQHPRGVRLAAWVSWDIREFRQRRRGAHPGRDHRRRLPGAVHRLGHARRRSDAVASIDRDAPVRFIRTAFETGDSIGVLLKIYRTGQVVQRIVPAATAASDRFQAWLRHMNARGWNVYVSVNAYRPGRSRARDAVSTVRHLFLEEDRDGPGLLAALSTRADLPPASYVLHSSPGRMHVLWRVQRRRRP